MFICGDFNSMPISSVMSVFHNEDILEQAISTQGSASEDQNSENQWAIPADQGDVSQRSVRRLYQIANQFH